MKELGSSPVLLPASPALFGAGNKHLCSLGFSVLQLGNEQLIQLVLLKHFRGDILRVEPEGSV